MITENRKTVEFSLLRYKFPLPKIEKKVQEKLNQHSLCSKQIEIYLPSQEKQSLALHESGTTAKPPRIVASSFIANFCPSISSQRAQIRRTGPTATLSRAESICKVVWRILNATQ